MKFCEEEMDNEVEENAEKLKNVILREKKRSICVNLAISRIRVLKDAR